MSILTKLCKGLQTKLWVTKLKVFVTNQKDYLGVPELLFILYSYKLQKYIYKGNINKKGRENIVIV
jgi:hypothetical protein